MPTARLVVAVGKVSTRVDPHWRLCPAVLAGVLEKVPVGRCEVNHNHHCCLRLLRSWWSVLMARGILMTIGIDLTLRSKTKAIPVLL